MSDLLEANIDELQSLQVRYDQLTGLIGHLVQRDPYAMCLRDYNLANGVSFIVHGATPDAVQHRLQTHMQSLIDVSDAHADETAAFTNRMAFMLGKMTEQGALVTIDDAHMTEHDIRNQARAVKATEPLYKGSGVNIYGEEHIAWCRNGLGAAYRTIEGVNHDVVFRKEHSLSPKRGQADLAGEQAMYLQDLAANARQLAETRLSLAESCMVMSLAVHIPVNGIPPLARTRVDSFSDIAKQQVNHGRSVLDLAARFRAMAYHVTEVQTPVFRGLNYLAPMGP